LVAQVVATQGWQLGHRPGLDGARGLAIVLVLAGHALPVGFAAGWVGVTLFFVLSGFLITSLLLEERAITGTVRLRQFFERRVRRLLPAFVVVSAVVLLSMVVIGQAEQGIFIGLVAASYISNWVIGGGTWLGPMSHTWSLAIEEQFYLVWPITMLVALRYLRAKQLAVLLVGLAAVIQIGRVVGWATGVQPERLAFATEFQADGLLLGCALAIVMHLRPFRVPLVARPLALVGLLVVAFIVPDVLRGFGNTVVVLLSTLLVAALVAPSGRDVVFQNRALVSLGLISYGLYLWHYPILWHLGFTDGRPYPGFGPAVLGIAMSIGVAAASYLWVERRFRSHSSRPAAAQRAHIQEIVPA
jgi:peptidoglycan/LPS O-acetylase OafA/YrhL